MLITSLNNKNVVNWAKLNKSKYQKQSQQFIIEERLLIEEAKKANLNCTIIARDGQDIEADFIVSDAVMRKISNNESLNDVIAVCDFYTVKAKKQSKIVYLDNVQDPGNVGTIIRSAHAFGFDLVVLANNTVNKYNPKLISAAKGAMFHIALEEELDLEAKINEGYKIYATALEKKAKQLSNFNNDDNIILVFGNEGSGVSEKVLKQASEKLYIPMSNFDSLNVAISAGIVLYHFREKSEG